MIVLDTHAVLWLLNDDPALGTRSRVAALEARNKNNLAIAAISFWEISLLVAKRRLDLAIRPSELRRELLDTGVVELPITGAIAILAAELDNLHGDPADRLIAASTIVHGATLMTADKRLLQWRHACKRQDASK